MKKLLILICLLTCSATIFGQNIFTYTVRARGGIIIGLNGIKIDSVTTSNDTLSFWHGATELHQKGVGTYPSAGIPLSTGSAWGTSITNNSVNWDTAYAARMRWSGTPIGLTAATGRTSLGGTTVGQAFFTLTNPSAITFPRMNADNTVTALSAANFKSALSLTSTDVGLGNVTNKAQVEVEDSAAMLLPYILDSEARKAINDSLDARIGGGTSVTDVGEAFITLANPGAVTFPQINADNTVSALSASAFSTAIGTPSIVNDTIEARLAAASVGLVVQDYEGGSTGNDYYLTPDQVRSLIVSSGGGLNGQILKFIVGTTSGAPTTSDSTLTHANFGGKHLDVYRDGALAYYNGAIAANLNEGFRLNTNTITVNPLWQDEEQVEIRILDPIAWSELSLEGEESTLLTGLSAYWKLDETSGSVATDATGTQDATVSGSPSRVPTQSGLGYGIRFNDDAHVMAIESPVAALDLDTTFSVSFWMKLDSMPSASARNISYIMYGLNTTTPTTSQRIYIPGLAGYIDNPLFRSANTADVSYQVAPNDAGLSDSTWYHIVVVQRGHGDTLYMYVNNVRETLTSGAQGIFYGTVGGTDDALRFGNSGAGAPWYLDGILDEIAIWKRELTPAEVGQLYNGGVGKTYPFN